MRLSKIIKRLQTLQKQTEGDPIVAAYNGRWDEYQEVSQVRKGVSTAWEPLVLENGEKVLGEEIFVEVKL